ncbi:helix-turn-helix transcriptional regulator [Cupriavidus pauculus]|uniref:helix-turn-helix transcriptional regulator n=1 Tax=Cupriavidus pauculus TaxID=82633 RepID=UPI001EE2D389|nr:helix-turn-helix transcriptional regulator [Cupriavidus pauculus]GJG95554.1 helix-turn-helix domain-containing protein [Cupriavidus pauculus]
MNARQDLNSLMDAGASALDGEIAVATGREAELGAFLRARRESLDPARIGLARAAGRRRTPGLRREEVAAMADIGITWYTKLEQGRPIRVSPKVLNAVAAALQCSATETEHLFTLAGLQRPAPLSGTSACETVSGTTQRLLDQLDPIPALVQNARFDIVAHNAAYCRLLHVDIPALPPEDRNCIYLALTHPGWRRAVPDWEAMVCNMVAMYRAAMAEHVQDPLWEAQLARYMAVSEKFQQLWQRYQVRGIQNHVKRFTHPATGDFQLTQTNFWTAPRNGARLLVYVPADEEAEAALRKLPRVDG